MSAFSRLVARWASVVALLFLVGCSSTSLVKTYDGPQVDPSRSAILATAEGIEIISVNGKEVKKYLIPELDINYQLLPGVNTVVFTHETLWAKPGKKEVGESNAELVVTKPMQVSFNARAGEVYRFKFGYPESRAEAYQFAESFKAELLDSSERVVAESTPYVNGADSTALAALPVNEASTATVAAMPVVAGAAVAVSTAPAASVPVAVAPAGGGALPTIDALKVLWESASTEEKKAFLKWAFK